MSKYLAGSTPSRSRGAYLPGSGLLLLVVGLMAPRLASAATWPDRTGEVVSGDFDGDGILEMVASSPESSCGKGVVYVIDAAGGSATSWSQDTQGVLGTAACSDFFGADLAVGDFDRDGYQDLAISAPGADDSGTSDAGVVHVLYGSATGLTASGDQMFHQDLTGIDDNAESGDDLGASLEAGDYNCDGYADLAIGVPREGFPVNIDDVGGVHVLYGSSSGVSTVSDWWHQGLKAVPGANQIGDHFGASLATGNFNGDTNGGVGCDDLAIGVPDEEAGSIADAGRVYAVYGGTSGLNASTDIELHQDQQGVADQRESNDRFSARLAVADDDGDSIDDLIVTVPGDADGCTPAMSVGRHVFYGGTSGFQYANNALTCTSYQCKEPTANRYRCLSSSRQAYATNAPETFVLFVGDNQVWGGSGANILLGEHGHDVLFGGGAADVLDGGPGLDIQIGGDGDDTFRINADCEAIAGEVIDGGDGNDTVQSHLSSSQLAALGVTIVSVENFVTIPEHPDGDVHCVLFPFEEGNIRQPVVTVAWDDLPDPTSTFRTSDGVLTLNVTSTASAAVDVDLTFTLRVRGSAVQLMTDPVSVSPQDPATVVLDLDDFIPSWVDPQAGNPTIYTSAWISTRATIKYSTGTTESAYAPTLFGHIDTTTDEAVLYRSKALHTQYNSGDLFHGPADENPWSVDNGGKGRIIGVAEAYGSLTVPTE